MRSLSRIAVVFGCLLLASLGLMAAWPRSAWAQDQAKHADVAYPQEALAFLPKEALDQLPQILTLFLTPADWTEVSRACNRPTARARVLGAWLLGVAGPLADVWPDNPANRRAAVNPATPPPTMTTSTGACSESALALDCGMSIRSMLILNGLRRQRHEA